MRYNGMKGNYTGITRAFMDDTGAKGRIAEIDVAKGMACLLMIAAHFISARLLPFGTFAAPLFFACSGMNTIVLLGRTRDNRRFDLFHLLFPALLFFGGVTQVAIAHGGPPRIVPEFLQCIALALLVLFLLSRVIRRELHIGWLFPLPFVVHQLVPVGFPDAPLNLFFSRGFALFPWLGFFLFGVLLLRLRRAWVPRLAVGLAAASAASLALSGRMPDKFAMSPSYALLALLASCLLFMLARAMAGGAGGVFRVMTGFFALPGRNSLMFVFLHYFALRFLATSDFFPHWLLYVVLEPLYLFAACWVLLRVYEEARHRAALLLPVLGLFAALAATRWGGWLGAGVDPRDVDLVVGVLFAFAYVLLRRALTAWLRRSPAAA